MWDYLVSLVTRMTSTYLPHAVELHGQRAEMILADQGVDLLLDIADKPLPRCQLIGSAEFPPGWQGVQQALRQQRHGTAPLKGVETEMCYVN